MVELVRLRPRVYFKMKKDKTDKDKTEKKPTDEALATLMLDRQERAQRCGKALDELLKKERCVLFAPIGLTEDGRIAVPSIQLKALD
jgi:hypothetical protein